MNAVADPKLYKPSDDGRAGRPFTMRLKGDDRKAIEHLMFLESQIPWQMDGRWKPYETGERRSLGAFIVWAAKQWRPPSKAAIPKAAPRSRGKTKRAPAGRRRRPPKRAGRAAPKRAPKRKRS